MSTLHILLAVAIASYAIGFGIFWTILLILLYRKWGEVCRAFRETARFFRELERRRA